MEPFEGPRPIVLALHVLAASSLLRSSFLFLVVFLVCGTFDFAQSDGVLRPTVKSGSSDHGLRLMLSQSPTPEQPDSRDLKACLSENLPLACTLLVITVKNEGKDTLLTWWQNCGHGEIAFDLQKSDGTWEPFPRRIGGSGLFCDLSFTYVERLAPGESHVEQMRLADPSLELDTELPLDDGRLHPRQPESEVFTATGPHKIRLHWDIVTCVASRKLKPDEVPNAFASESFCAVDADMSKKSVIPLQSNELSLSLSQH